MKSFKIPRRLLLALSEKTAVFTGLIVALAAFSAIGCTSRKQYAINEAILISERRQLEDEIYRTKFELRDALKENERLREQLGKAGSDDNAAKKSNSARRPQIDSAMYPGGSQLQVGGSQTAPAYRNMVDPDRYDDSAPRGTLPDFAPVPAQNRFSQNAARAKKDAPRLAAEKGFGVSRPVAVENARANSNRVASSEYVAPRSSEQKVEQTSYEAPDAVQAAGFEPASEDDWSPVGAF